MARGALCVQGRRARGAPSGERQAAGVPLLSQLNKSACFLFLGSGQGRDQTGSRTVSSAAGCQGSA